MAEWTRFPDGSPNDQFAHLSGRQFVHFIIDDAGIQVKDGFADGPGFRKRQLLFQGGNTGCRFAHPKPLLERNTGLVVLPDEADGQRSTAAHDYPYMVKCSGIKIRMLNQRQKNGRHAEKQRDVFLFEQC